LDGGEVDAGNTADRVVSTGQVRPPPSSILPREGGGREKAIACGVPTRFRFVLDNGVIIGYIS